MLDMDDTENTFHDNLYHVVPEYKKSIDQIAKHKQTASPSYDISKFKV